MGDEHEMADDEAVTSIGVIRRERSPGDNSTHRLTGSTEWYDFQLRFDVHWNVERKSHSNLTAIQLGWAGERSCDTNAFIPRLPAHRELPLPPMCSGRDANDRRAINAFRWLFDKAPDVRGAARPIILRIASPSRLDDSKINALRKLLSLRECLWTGSWKATTINHIKRYQIALVAEPISDDLWPHTVELSLAQVHHSNFLEQDIYSLAATGYHNFAGLKISCSRLFPFCVSIDEEFKLVEKCSLAIMLTTAFAIPVLPHIKICGVVFPTNENIWNAEFYSCRLLKQLVAPIGVPPLEPVSF